MTACSTPRSLLTASPCCAGAVLLQRGLGWGLQASDRLLRVQLLLGPRTEAGVISDKDAVTWELKISEVKAAGEKACSTTMSALSTLFPLVSIP